MGHTRRAWAGISSASLAMMLSISASASAEEAADDGARFRGGLMAELGPGVWTTEGHFTMGAGLQGHVGVQISDAVGVYWGPRVQVLAGDIGGVYTGWPFVVDFTIDDLVSLGLGPELGAWIQVLDESGTISSPQVGGLVHVAVYPERDDDGRRVGPVFGADLAVRASGTAYTACGGPGCGPEGPPLLIAPTFFIGHEVY
jgi:hypothetical protein